MPPSQLFRNYSESYDLSLSDFFPSPAQKINLPSPRLSVCLSVCLFPPPLEDDWRFHLQAGRRVGGVDGDPELYGGKEERETEGERRKRRK